MRSASDILKQFGLPTTNTLLGRHYMTCPRCSANRAREHQQLKCLGITIDDKGVHFGCNHCDWHGGGYYDDGPRRANGKDHKGRLGQIIAAYDYCDEYGEFLFQVVRFDPKDFRQRVRDPTRPDGWSWSVKGVRRVVFRLPELNEAIANEHVVLVVEGEKDVLNLAHIGIIATCNPGGAAPAEAKKPKWKHEYSELLRGADVVIVPDNDEAGYTHAAAVAAMTVGIAKRVRTLNLAAHWPDCPKGGDISDWLAAGHTREQLDDLINQAPEWQGAAGQVDTAADKSEEKVKAEANEQKLIDELAQLNRVEYDRRRKDEARALGIRSSSLDAEVEARRAQQREQAGPAPLFGHWVVEPWPDPVDPAELLEDITREIHRYSVIPDHLADASAMWTQIGWNLDIATHSPILLIGSSDHNSGKTTLLDVVGFVARRPLSTVEITDAALFRSIERWEPTVMIDEGDYTFKKNESGLRALINSVWTRGKYVLRCVGDDQTPHAFPTFCSVAFAMNGKHIPPSTLSRSIRIWMVRKLPTETCDGFDRLDKPMFGELRQRSLRFALDHREDLRAAMKKTAIPRGMDSRAAENFRLQFAFADLAGKGWVDRIRKAAEKITGTMDVSTRNTRLLAAIKRVFDAKHEAEQDSTFPSPDPGFVGSYALIELLKADPESEVHEWAKGKPITVNQLAAVLGLYGITSTHNKAKEARGYYEWQFKDTFERYL